jgi:hypothetical protein
MISSQSQTAQAERHRPSRGQVASDFQHARWKDDMTASAPAGQSAGPISDTADEYTWQAIGPLVAGVVVGLATESTPITAAESAGDLRFQRDVERVWRRGPGALHALFVEISLERLLRTYIEETVATYATINSDAITVTGGDAFPAVPLRVIGNER